MPETKIALVLSLDEVAELNAAAADRLASYAAEKHRVRWPALVAAKEKLERALKDAPVSESEKLPPTNRS